MRENGLRIEGDRGETHIRPAQATDDIASIGVVDFVLLCVKLWDLESAGQQLRTAIGAGTAVVPLQNGVDAAERLIPILGREAVMGGVAFVTGTIAAPGIIRQTGTYQRMTFGELDGRLSERGERLRDLCDAAGFEGVLSPDIRVPIWEKFILLVPLSGLHALTRVPLGVWRDDPDLLGLYEAALRETVVDAGTPYDLDGERPAPWYTDRAPLVCRQGRQTRAPPRHPDANQRLHLCGVEAVHQRAAGILTSRTQSHCPRARLS